MANIIYPRFKPIIEVSSSKPALKITQKGTGASLFVGDQKDDTSGFLIDKDGGVAIGYDSGSSALGYKLLVNGQSYFINNLIVNSGGGYFQNYVQTPSYVSASSVTASWYSASQGYLGRFQGTASYANDADKLDGLDSTIFARTGSVNTFTANNNFTTITGSSAYFTNNLTVLGTASIAMLNTVNQQSLQIGDKYITIMSGTSTHVELDGAGILYGSGSTDITTGDQKSVAYVLYRKGNAPTDYISDYIEVFPGLRVSGSLTASSTSYFTDVTASVGYKGRLYDTASYALDADKLDGQDSLLFALKTDVTGALLPYVTLSGVSSSVAFLTASNVFTNDQIITGSLYVTGSTNSSIFDVSSSNPALKITQRGSGPTLFIEDQDSPDNTGFVIDKDGRVGIGYNTSSALTYQLMVFGGGYFSNALVGNSTFTANSITSSNGYTGSFYRGNQYTASEGYIGRLFGTSSYSLDADKFDGLDSSLFALKTDVTGATQNYATRTEITGALSTYALSSDVSSSFALKTDLTASYARKNVSNVFTADQTISASLYISGSSYFDVSSSDPVVKFTQRGSGPVLFIEDQSPESNGFLIDKDGNVAIGSPINNTINRKLYVYGNTYSDVIESPQIRAVFSYNSFITASIYKGNEYTASVGFSGSSINISGQSNLLGGQRVNYSTKTSNYSLTASTDYVVLFSGSNLTGTLPNCTTCPGTTFIIKNKHTTPLYVTSSGGTIDGDNFTVIDNIYYSLTLLSDGTGWNIV